MIQAVSGGGSIGLEAVAALRYARMDGKAVIMPVRPAQMITASFKHIQMLPDSTLRDGVPLYKLKILDALIDRFSRAGGQGADAAAVSTQGAGGVDALITSMAGALRGSSAAYRPGLLPVPGAFVDLLA
jgi:hypothetical protein